MKSVARGAKQTLVREDHPHTQMPVHKAANGSVLLPSPVREAGPRDRTEL